MKKILPIIVLFLFGFTGFLAAQSITLADDGDITEGSENTEEITVTLSSDTFIATIDPLNISVTNLPGGVDYTITRQSDTELKITLDSDRTQDYDTDITDMTVSISHDELVTLGTGSVDANSGVTFDATDDTESMTMSGTINEGSEDTGEIVVTLTGGTFIGTLDAGNWDLANLPAGVTKESVTRNNGTQVTIALQDNRDDDYDSDITNLTLTVDDVEVNDTTGSDFVLNTGVTFVANNDTESMTMSDDGTIDEGSEGGEQITVTLTGGTFVGSLTATNWALSNLPAGVTRGNVDRDSDTQVTITLNDDRDDDYDSDITNLTLTVSDAEVNDTSGGSGFVVNTGVTFTANNDVESISMADDGTITEALEDGEIITVTLTGGTFVSSLTTANWVLTNLPAGVNKGTLTRSDENTATIELSGNRTGDYSSNITNLTLTIQSSEINDTSGGSGLVVNTGVTFEAVDEPTATLVTGDVGFCQGDSYFLRVNVSGGTGPYDVKYKRDGANEVALVDSVGPILIEVTQAGTYTLSEVKDANEVYGTFSGSSTVTVHALPTPTIDGLYTTCNGALDTYKAVGTTGSTYTWDEFNDGSAVGDTDLDSLVMQWVWNNAKDEGNMRVHETTTDGCVGSSAKIDVVLQDSPGKPTITTPDQANDHDVCSGTTLKLRSSDAGDGKTYLWNNGVATRNNLVSVSGSYRVRIVKTTTGCASDSSDAWAVTSHPSPSAVISVDGDNSICINETGTWEVSIFSGTADFAVDYTDGTTPVSTTKSDDFFITDSESTPQTMTYTITSIIDSEGCAANILEASADITVNDKPTVTFTPPVTNFLNTDPEVTLTGGSPGGGIYSGDAVTGGKFYPSLATTATPNAVTYTYTDGNGCSDDETEQFNVTIAQGDFTTGHAYDNGSGSLIYCYSTEFDTLTGVVQNMRPGGWFVGPGITNPAVDIGFFNPAVAGAGDHIIYYYYYVWTNEPLGLYSLAFISKTFRVDDPGSITISGLDRAYCANDDSLKVTLVGTINNDGVPGFNGVEQLTGLGVTNPFPDIYYFDPQKGSPGERVVTYNYTRDFSQCMIVDTFKVIVDALPQISFNILDSCIFLTSGTDSIHFNNTSPVQSPSIVSWDWNFGDAQHSSIVSPWHDYNSVGTKLIKLTAVNDRGCIDNVQKIKEFQEITRALFDWEKECLGDTMHFMFDFAEVEGTAISWKWDFDDGTTSPGTTDSEPYHKYNISDNYEVVLKVENDFGCRDTVTQTVPVRPTFLVNSANPYFEDFTSGSGGWLTDADEGSSNSWEFGRPSGTIFSDTTQGDAWVTSLGGLYTSDEKSYVESPCFDFSEIKKPMVRMDVWVHTENTRDGAAIQTSIDDGKTWTVLGSNLDGINWYNSALLTGEPGGQRLGWTGTSQSEWKEARNMIDHLKGKKFRLRVAFGSDAVASNFEGFAFDNVWVGERTRMVLLEHFTNSTSAESLDADPDVNGITSQNPEEVIDIQYHTSFPGEDTRNTYFPSGPSSRTLYYGVASVPFSMMDGIEPFSGFDPVTFDYNWMELDLLKNVLIDPLTTINLNTSYIIGNNIYVEADLGLIETTLSTANLTLHIAVVENESSVFESVLKKMLPDAGGTSLIDLWDGNNSAMVYQSWAFNPADFVAVDSLVLVAFIQNEDTKDVYQAAYLTFKSILTGIYDSPVDINELDYMVYPNPASGEVFLKFEQTLEGGSQMHVFNELGALVDLIKLEKGNDLYSFDVSNYNQGVYFIQVTDAENKAMGWKRLIVIH